MITDKIRTLGDRILILPAKAEEITTAGIIIPDAAKEKQMKGEVMAVSADVKHVAVGNQVLYGKHAGTPLELEEETYLIMKESDILAIIL